MALDLSGLSKYTDELSLELISAAILEARTTQFVTVQPGVKYKTAINILESTLVIQDGGCGWSPSGSTKPIARDLEVCDLRSNESICPNDLADYWAGQLMKSQGSSNESIPFEQAYVDLKVRQLKDKNEILIWQGGSCDGFIDIIDDAAGDYITGTTQSAFTVSNAITFVEDMVSNIATDILDRDDLIYFISYEDFKTYTRALRAANLFHYNGNNNELGSHILEIPGTNVKMVAVKGLNNTGSHVLSYGANFYVGTDLVNELDKFEVFYSKDNDEVRVRANYKLGVQIAFPQFVTYKNV